MKKQKIKVWIMTTQNGKFWGIDHVRFMTLKVNFERN